MGDFTREILYICPATPKFSLMFIIIKMSNVSMLVCFSAVTFLPKSSSRVDGELGFFQTKRKEGERGKEIEDLCKRVAKMMKQGIYAVYRGSVNESRGIEKR